MKENRDEPPRDCGFLTRIRRPRTGKRGISAGQRRESAERRVPLGGSLFPGAALEVPDDSLQAWPAAPIAAFNGHGFLVRKPQYIGIREAHVSLLKATAPGKFGRDTSTLAFAFFASPTRAWKHLGAAHHGHVRTNG